MRVIDQIGSRVFSKKEKKLMERGLLEEMFYELTIWGRSLPEEISGYSKTPMKVSEVILLMKGN